MATYLVQWEIEIDAHNPRTAARMALQVMRDPHSTAQHFTILDEEGDWEADVDLWEEDNR